MTNPAAIYFKNLNALVVEMMQAGMAIIGVMMRHLASSVYQYHGR